MLGASIELKMDQENPEGEGDSRSSLERIKKQLNRGAGNVLLQGPLLKRSDTIRKWNSRWFTLDVSMGKLEYRSQRGDPSPRGLVTFGADSIFTVSPINMMKEQKYDGCCFYISTPKKKEQFFCAETPEAARAWVATLRSAALVLKAHTEAVNLLSGNGQCKLGTVATVVAAANATAREAAKDLQAASFPASSSQKKLNSAGGMDSSDLLKETLRVKEEELHQLATDLRLRDLTIKELADRLTETANKAESAATAVHAVDKDCNEALAEVDRLRNQLVQAVQQIRGADTQKATALKVEETALQEAHRCRLELGKIRERGVILEAAMMRVEEDIRRLKVTNNREIAECLQIKLARTINLLPAENPVVEDPEHNVSSSEGSTTGLQNVQSLSPRACLLEPAMPSTSEAQAPELLSARSEEKNASGLTGVSQKQSLDGGSGFKNSEEIAESTDLIGQELRSSEVPGVSDAPLFNMDSKHLIIHESAVSKHTTIPGVLETMDSDEIQDPGPGEYNDSQESKMLHHEGDSKDEVLKVVVDGGFEDEGENCIHSDGNEFVVEEQVSHAAKESLELANSLDPSLAERVMIDLEHHECEGTFSCLGSE